MIIHRAAYILIPRSWWIHITVQLTVWEITHVEDIEAVAIPFISLLGLWDDVFRL